VPRRASDPFASFNFLVEIDGVTRAGFSEVTGLNTEVNVVEYREGTDPNTPRKLPGLFKNSNVTLKRGVSLDTDLFNLYKTAVDGDIRRVNMSIVLRDEKQTEVVRWNLLEAWVSKYVVPDLKANANEMAIETVELAHEGVQRQ
jgi:phage tail-like protein